MNSVKTTIPIFPLPLVLFPGGKLPLQIFEARYIDMIREALQKNGGFGIIMIKQGEQVIKGRQVASPQVSRVGTYVNIVDFDQSPNGLLRIMVQGQAKFRIEKITERDNRLMMGDAEFIESEPGQPIPEDRFFLVQLLQNLSEHEAVQLLGLDINYEDARDVSCRLAELIPIPNEERQGLLELEDPLLRLDELAGIVARLQQLQPLQ